MATQRNVTYKCPFCTKRFNRQDLVDHVGKVHEDELPEDFTPLRYVFNYVNRKPVTYHGKCTECGRPTEWDENKGRYNRQCDRPACKESYIRKFEDNMKRTNGVERISQTEEGQKKMLANRRISGKYKFQDGGVKDYCGSYELKALEFMDQVMNIRSDDLLCPGPVLNYELDGKIHMYITDFYYIPYDLVIEVKDGGDNPNNRNMPEYRAKQIAKEEFIIKNTSFNYLRLTNNNLEQLVIVFADLKYQLLEKTGKRVIHVNEMMGMASYAPVVGMRDSDTYIVNYQMNNVFADDEDDRLGLTNSIKCDDIVSVNNGKLTKVAKEDITIKNIYKSGFSIEEINEKFGKYMDKEVDNGFIYETLFGNTYYFADQIKLCGLEEVNTLDNIIAKERSIFENHIYGYDEINKICDDIDSLKEGRY